MGKYGIITRKGYDSGTHPWWGPEKWNPKLMYLFELTPSKCILWTGCHWVQTMESMDVVIEFLSWRWSHFQRYLCFKLTSNLKQPHLRTCSHDDLFHHFILWFFIFFLFFFSENQSWKLPFLMVWFCRVCLFTYNR